MDWQTDIPIPPNRRGAGHSKYPFGQMPVGASIFFPGLKIKKSGSIVSWVRRTKGYKFTARTVTEDGVKGVRIWRTE